MRIAVEHDEQGKITAVVVPTAGHDKHLELHPHQGRHVVEIDAGDLVEHPMDVEGLEKLRGYRVADSGAGAHLVRHTD
jgi:hypothetical protein